MSILSNPPSPGAPRSRKGVAARLLRQISGGSASTNSSRLLSVRPPRLSTRQLSNSSWSSFSSSSSPDEATAAAIANQQQQQQPQQQQQQRLRRLRSAGGVRFRDPESHAYHENPHSFATVKTMWFSRKELKRFDEEDAANFQLIATLCRKRVDGGQYTVESAAEKQKAMAFRSVLDDIALLGQAFGQATTPSAEFVGLEHYVSKEVFEARHRRQAAVLKNVFEVQRKSGVCNHDVERIRKASLSVSYAAVTQARVVAQAALDIE